MKPPGKPLPHTLPTPARPRPSFPARLPGLSAAAQVAAPAAARSSVSVGARATGLGLDSDVVRAAMVRRLVAEGVSDSRVLAALAAVPRHRFVDSALVNQAYEDTSLPIGLGQTISKPSVVARMLELLVHGREGRLGRVLEVGCGCGYQAALLTHLCDEVYSIERLRGLHERARENLRDLRLQRLHLLLGDGMAGYAPGAPYAGLIAAAGGEALPQAWLDQLEVGGRLVAPLAQSGGRAHSRLGAQALVVVDKTPQGLRQTVLEAVQFVPLKSGMA